MKGTWQNEISGYFSALFSAARQGDAREESFYPALRSFLETAALANGKKGAQVTMLPKPTEAGNPDFRVWDGQSRIMGYVEAKPPGDDVRHYCRVELQRYDLILIFQNNKLFFVFTDQSQRARNLVEAVRFFLIYHSFINYNVVSPGFRLPDSSKYDEVDLIKFQVKRIKLPNIECKEGESLNKYPYYRCENESLEVSIDSLAHYLDVLNPTIYYALAFYLIGCDNQRYFLVEFYKAVEVILNSFGGKAKFLKSLEPYGIKKKKFSEFGKLCNDMRLAPLDIGRHAPMPGASLYAVDLRRLLVEPRSRNVFESTTSFCRQVIDAYLTFLIKHDR